MFKIFTLKLEKHVNFPKNWFGRLQRQISGRYALVTAKDSYHLWDLNEVKIVPGRWTSLHPCHDTALKWTTDREEVLELCDIKSGKVLTRFEDKAWLQLSPYGSFATYALSQDYDDRRYNLKSGQKRSLPIYSTETGKCIYRLEIPHVLGIFLPHHRLASIDSVGKISIYDLATGQLITKLKGLGRRPLFIRTDLSGKKMFIYGVHWKKNEGIYKVWDVENFILITEQSGEHIHFGHHLDFSDGIQVVGDNAILNTETNTLHKLWMGVYYGSPHIQSLTPLFEWPYFAAIVCRDKSGIKDNLEIWDVSARKCLGSLELEKRAHALIPLEKNKIAIFYSLDGKPIYDDKDDPTLSIYSFKAGGV